MRSNSPVRKVARVFRSLVGQRYFYRTIRFLMHEARFDVLNEPATNGEYYIQSVVLQHTPHCIVFDIEAHRGDWTASLLKQRSTNVVVHAFEPSATIFDIFQERTANLQSVIPVNMACTDHVGESRFVVPGSVSGIGSIVAQDSHSEDSTDTEMVTLTTVDTYSRENHILHIDLLKIDTEGHDLLVLFGADSMLRSHSIDVVQFEYNHRWIYERRLLRDAFEYLKPIGYSIGKITGDAIQFYPEWHWELETYCEANYVACTPELVKFFHTVPTEWVPY
jgi:FkbM family methyltransferase